MDILGNNEDMRIEYHMITYPIADDTYYKNAYTFDIILLKSNDECTEQTEEKIGCGQFELFNFMACHRHRTTIDDVPECIDDDMFLDYFYDWGTEKPRRFWSKMLLNNANVLNLDIITIYPEYRGKGYGKLVVKDIFERFYGSFGVMATIVFPLQHAKDFDFDSEKAKLMKYEFFVPSYEESYDKLCRYCRSLGFKNLKNTEIFYLDPFNKRQKLDCIEPRISYPPMFCSIH